MVAVMEMGVVAAAQEGSAVRPEAVLEAVAVQVKVAKALGAEAVGARAVVEATVRGVGRAVMVAMGCSA